MSIKDGLLATTKQGWKVVLPNGYVFDRRVFIIFSAVLITISIVLVMTYGIGKEYVYLHCPPSSIGGQCYNPLYNACTAWYCQLEVLPAGFTYGKPPPPLLAFFTAIAFAGIFISFLVNHLLFNKEFHEKE